MVEKRITPLLLAASVLVSGFTGAFIDSKPAQAITRVDELADVQESNWAYDALKDLVEKYNVIEGYPDRTFRGNRTANRYELAAALNATIKALGKEIARLGAEKANKEDLATVARLQQEFAVELTALQARTNALEARATKIEAKNEEQDNRLAVLEKLKVYGDASFGGYADIAGNPGSAFQDGISAVGRARINMDYPVVEDKGGDIVGPGTVHTRLIAAFGRSAPLLADDGTVANNRFSGASWIAGDSSFYNEGFETNDYGANFGANTRANAYLDSMYYSQNLRASIPGLPSDESWRTNFVLHGGLIPWRDLFLKSPYFGNEQTQFQNTALVVNPGILQNITDPRFALEIKQGMGKWVDLTLKGEASSYNVSDWVRAGFGFTTEADLGYNLGFLNDIVGTQELFNLAGNMYGAYYHVGAQDEHISGFYAGANQELYKGIGVWGNVSANEVSSGFFPLQYGRLINNNGSFVANQAGLPLNVRSSWSLGTEIPMRALPGFLTFGKRQRDAFGVGYAKIYGADRSVGGAIPAAFQGEENVIEAYYKLQVTDNFAVIPSFQAIWDRAGDQRNDANVVIGLRSSFSF